MEICVVLKRVLGGAGESDFWLFFLPVFLSLKFTQATFGMSKMLRLT